MDRGRILVVESDPTRAQATELVLSQFGHYEVSLVSSGLDALQKIRSESYDLVLINPLFTKDEGGLKLTRLILLQRHPVMIVTHVAAKGLIQRFGKAGIFDYVLFPWDPTDFLKRIERIIQARRSLEGPDLDKHINGTLSKILALPTISPVYAEVEKVVHKPDATAEEIAKIIELDQSITAKVLRLANSAHFGFNRRVTSIRDAVALLGSKTTENVVLTVSTFEAMDKIKLSGSFDRTAFWEHSIACGAAAKAIARSLEMDEDVHFSAGILHDIGKVVLDGFFPDYFDRAVKIAVKRDIPIAEAEQETLGITHGDVGSHLVQRWDLPEIFIKVTRAHNSLSVEDKQYEKSVALVHMANILCRILKVGSSGDTWSNPEALSSAFRELGVGQKTIDKWMPDITQEIQSARSLLALT